MSGSEWTAIEKASLCFMPSDNWYSFVVENDVNPANARMLPHRFLISIGDMLKSAQQR